MTKTDIKFIMKKQAEISKKKQAAENMEKLLEDDKKSKAKKYNEDIVPRIETASAAIAYAISIIMPFFGPSIIFFLADKDDKYTRYHAAVATALSFVMVAFIAALAASVVGLCIAIPGAAAYVIAMLYLALRAFNLEPYEVPVFNEFGKRYE